MTGDDLRKMLSEATPGPWETRFPNRVSVPREPDEEYEEDFSTICKGRQENCNLIAAAPALASELLAARDLVRRLAEALDAWTGTARGPLRDIFADDPAMGSKLDATDALLAEARKAAP